MTSFDPRITPAKPDLAAARLRGQVEADRFVDGEVFEVVDAHAPLRRAPRPDAALDTEALRGDRVTVYERDDEGWCWGQLQSDGYVGWIPANALMRPQAAPTHKVTTLRTLAFPGPDIKIPPVGWLPLGAKITLLRQEKTFAVFSGGFLPARHLAPLETQESDAVAVAERFLGTPYLWGGRTPDGIDCSGLVQLALTACGCDCPRDSDMQERALGTAIGDFGDIRRGDLIFWKGHVAMARGGGTIIHANAHHMAVAIEPLVEALARITAAGSEVISIKRLS